MIVKFLKWYLSPERNFLSRMSLFVLIVLTVGVAVSVSDRAAAWWDGKLDMVQDT
jgi:hypothetical protein